MLNFLQSLEAFKDLKKSTLETLVAAAEEVSVPSDAWLFREGEPADAFFLVRSGLVCLTVQTPQGGSAVLKRATTGTVVGEKCVFGGVVRTTSARTDEPSILLKIRTTSFKAVAAREPALRARIRFLAGIGPSWNSGGAKSTSGPIFLKVNPPSDRKA